MEISEREYYQLREQVQTLQGKVESMSASKRTNLLGAMNEAVISSVQNITAGKPIFGYSRFNNNDVWPLLLQMAKAIHEPSNVFYMSTACPNGYPHPYIRSTAGARKPRKLTDLSESQFDLSAQMLNEMIPIYNRYFKFTHQRVLYDATGRGDYQSIGVVDDSMELEDA